ncbi:uncharacterized protein ATC70_005723 [Mucor velutinosus]|uniref:Reverse transcriptase zinc-binding domain-containing protein n=1 Tax=Mucor velutinosus TaxID=708070 RepID=A0AAN7DBH5_9FUNG|nr:hypothetical protein ATC70_005723 [Mucor velutinosus]
MYHTYLSASPSISDVDLIHFLQQTLLCSSPLLDRDPSLSFNELSIPQLFATTLLTIWQAHWRWIFDRTPFIADTVQLRLARSLARLDAELNLDSTLNKTWSSSPLQKKKCFFKLAFDPFLRSIQHDPQFTGFNLPAEAPSPLPDTLSDDISESIQHLFSDSDASSFDRDTPAPQPALTISPLAVKILTYADDTLMYLHDTHDFHRLQSAISVYMKASNALLNYHKSIATSLSGKPSATWQALMTSHGITAWHDRTSATPLIYLGYPICSSITQRNVAFQKLYDIIRNAIAIHSQRNISIRGRATILNSLIYSKLWHVLRLTTFTKAQFLSLRSLGTSFINFHIFPRISFATLSLTRSSGGLGLLDPLSQQLALQWYWVLCPLLLQYLGSPALSNFIPPNLLLLGSDVAKKLLVSDVFRFDADLQVLRLRSPFQSTRHPIASQRVHDHIVSSQLLLQPFLAQQRFVSPRPSLDPHQSPSLRALCRSILVPPLSSSLRGRLPLNSIRFFKRLRQTSSSSSSSSLSPLRPSQWRSFWAEAIPLAARTVWYRAIHEKMPTRALLHLRLPEKHPSPHCTICSTSTTEDITHALFSCPPKLQVWRNIYHSYLSVSSPISDVDLLTLLQQILLDSSPPLDRDATLPFSDLSIP